MDEPTERLLDYDGGQLYVRDHPGRTPAIVAMHGFPDDSRIYDRLIGPLDPQRVVTFDWIGYGRSSRRDSGQTCDHIIDLVRRGEPSQAEANCSHPDSLGYAHRGENGRELDPA